MKRIKANNSTSSFILLFLFFLIAITFMLGFLSILSMKKTSDDNKESSIDETTTTTVTTTTVKTEPVELNFEASLARILSDTELVGKYNIEVGYQNAKFIFKCSTYNEAEDVCEMGSASMMLNDNITYNLYTFASSTYDHSLRPNDYYIIVQDDYVIISMNKVGIEPGVMKIYNRKGKNVKDIKNYISGYLKEDRIINMQYPEYDNGILKLYYCNKNTVVKSTVDLTENFKEITSENLSDVTCY